MSHRTSPSAWSSLALVLLVPMWLLAAPSVASAQHTRGGGGSGGHASGGRASTGGGHASGGGRSGTQSTGTAVPRGSTPSGGDSGSTRGSSSPRGSSARPSGGSSSSGADSGMATPATPHSRPRGNAPAVGEAVPRTGAPAPHGGGVLVPGGYYGGFIPWGFGGLGLYGGYYGGYYDPWFDPYYGGGYYAPPDTDEQGSVRLKVKPRDASVFVDGYYAGVVDDFDGVFQRLHIDPGPHRIEISAPGYDTLSFEVRVLPGQTVTYRGELKQE